MKYNELFDNEQSLELFDSFQSFLDPKTNKMNMEILLDCARTLGLNTKYPTIMTILTEIDQEYQQLDFETFLSELTERLGNIRTKEGRETLFKIIDTNEKGQVTFDDLKKLAKEVGHTVSDEDLKEIMQNISKNNTISLEEFERYLSRKIERDL